MLSRAGAAHIDAVEANTLAYMRCLIGKDIIGTSNTTFLLGDFVRWLSERDSNYDMIVASGVLYHSHDPVHLLELISARTDRLYIWTHYYDDLLKGDDRGVPFSGQKIQREFKGQHFTLHERSYHKAWQDPKFCGGPRDAHFWMERDDILRLLNMLGFTCSTAHDMPGHVNGPCISIYAARNNPKAMPIS